MNEFTQFNLHESLELALNEAGFKTPSPIQKEAIPLILKGFDIVAQAHTGTGKTAAFGLAILNQMNFQNGVQTLVVTPTRELCMQVSDELYKLGKHIGAKTTSVYGSQSYQRQIEKINKANIIVATPGRLLDLLKNNQILIKPNFVVLDEADEMLDMGFLDDIKQILNFMPKNAQKLLFSATMPEPIKNIAKDFLKEPKIVQITDKIATNKDIQEEYYVVKENERTDATVRLIDYYNPQKAIIFCRMKKEADMLSNSLLAKGYATKALHGDMEQREREITIRAFKSSQIEILVATDVAARGLDIGGVSHVFNYHIPFNPQSYVHRIGRTGRAGQKGVAITLVSPLEFKDLQRIKQSVGSKISHKYIPTMQDLTDGLSKKLIQQVLNQQVSQKSHDILSKLQESIDVNEVALKLLTIMIESQKIRGPENIGLDANNIKILIEKMQKEKLDKSKNYKNKRNYKNQRNQNKKNNKRKPKNKSF